METGTSNVINALSAAVQAFATLVLVVITVLQMRQTNKSLGSMERSMKADFLPILAIGHRMTRFDEKVLSIYMTNCGKGIARKPKIIFPGQKDIVLNSLQVAEDENAQIEYNIEYILTKVPEYDRKIVIEYRDVYDRKITTEAKLVEKNNLGPDGKLHGLSWDTWTPIIP